MRPMLTILLLSMSLGPTQWAGHQAIFGTAHVPLLGERATRTDSFFLATVENTPTGLRLQQRTCHVDISPVAGVRSNLPQSSYAGLPVAGIDLTQNADGRLTGVWLSAWTHADHDGDGQPGVTVHVDAPLCSGQVYLTSQSETSANAGFVGTDLEGEVQVRFTQEIVGASNACLRWGAANVQDVMRGIFRYHPVAESDTCDSLALGAWPVVD